MAVSDRWQMVDEIFDNYIDEHSYRYIVVQDKGIENPEKHNVIQIDINLYVHPNKDSDEYMLLQPGDYLDITDLTNPKGIKQGEFHDKYNVVEIPEEAQKMKGLLELSIAFSPNHGGTEYEDIPNREYLNRELDEFVNNQSKFWGEINKKKYEERKIEALNKARAEEQQKKEESKEHIRKNDSDLLESPYLSKSDKEEILKIKEIGDYFKDYYDNSNDITKSYAHFMLATEYVLAGGRLTKNFDCEEAMNFLEKKASVLLTDSLKNKKDLSLVVNKTIEEIPKELLNKELKIPVYDGTKSVIDSLKLLQMYRDKNLINREQLQDMIQKSKVRTADVSMVVTVKNVDFAKVEEAIQDKEILNVLDFKNCILDNCNTEGLKLIKISRDENTFINEPKHVNNNEIKNVNSDEIDKDVNKSNLSNELVEAIEKRMNYSGYSFDKQLKIHYENISDYDNHYIEYGTKVVDNYKDSSKVSATLAHFASGLEHNMELLPNKDGGNSYFLAIPKHESKLLGDDCLQINIPYEQNNKEVNVCKKVFKDLLKDKSFVNKLKDVSNTLFYYSLFHDGNLAEKYRNKVAQLESDFISIVSDKLKEKGIKLSATQEQEVFKFDTKAKENKVKVDKTKETIPKFKDFVKEITPKKPKMSKPKLSKETSKAKDNRNKSAGNTDLTNGME